MLNRISRGNWLALGLGSALLIPISKAHADEPTPPGQAAKHEIARIADRYRSNILLLGEAPVLKNEPNPYAGRDSALDQITGLADLNKLAVQRLGKDVVLLWPAPQPEELISRLKAGEGYRQSTLGARELEILQDLRRELDNRLNGAAKPDTVIRVPLETLPDTLQRDVKTILGNEILVSMPVLTDWLAPDIWKNGQLQYRPGQGQELTDGPKFILSANRQDGPRTSQISVDLISGSSSSQNSASLGHLRTASLRLQPGLSADKDSISNSVLRDLPESTRNKLVALPFQSAGMGQILEKLNALSGLKLRANPILAQQKVTVQLTEVKTDVLLQAFERLCSARWSAKDGWLELQPLNQSRFATLLDQTGDLIFYQFGKVNTAAWRSRQVEFTQQAARLQNDLGPQLLYPTGIDFTKLPEADQNTIRAGAEFWLLRNTLYQQKRIHELTNQPVVLRYLPFARLCYLDIEGAKFPLLLEKPVPKTEAG